MKTFLILCIHSAGKINRDISCSSTVLVDMGYMTSHQTVVASALLLSSTSKKIPQFSGNKLHLSPHICTSTHQKYTHIMSDWVSHWLFTVKAWVQSQPAPRGKKLHCDKFFSKYFCLCLVSMSPQVLCTHISFTYQHYMIFLSLNK